jgi:hypothetical protein
VDVAGGAAGGVDFVVGGALGGLLVSGWG